MHDCTCDHVVVQMMQKGLLPHSTKGKWEDFAIQEEFTSAQINNIKRNHDKMVAAMYCSISAIRINHSTLQSWQ